MGASEEDIPNVYRVQELQQAFCGHGRFELSDVQSNREP